MAETTRNHIFFKRNQSSDNRSYGFGAKFLLKKLSASDFSYERKSALRGTFCFQRIASFLGWENEETLIIFKI